MSCVFIFCHGFGFTQYYWEKIAPYFKNEKSYFLDLGYFHADDNLEDKDIFPLVYGDKIVLIGHSLGLIKLAQYYKDAHYLVGLNGFSHFLGNDHILQKKRLLELKMMKKSFMYAPKLALKNFYKRCSMEDFYPFQENYKQPKDALYEGEVNQTRLLKEFDVLAKKHDFPKKPTLIISGQKDYVLPLTVAIENFSHKERVKHLQIEEGGHNLGYSKPDNVYNEIMRFLNADSTRCDTEPV